MVKVLQVWYNSDMQGFLVYIFNIAFIILYMKVMEVCTRAEGSTGLRWIRDLRLLFLILLIRTVINFAFDMGLIQADVQGMGRFYLNMNTTADTLICLFYIWFVTDFLGRKERSGLYFVLALCAGLEFAAIDAVSFTVLAPLGQSAIFLSAVATFVYGVVSSRGDKEESAGVFRRLCMVATGFAAAIFVENIWVYLANDKGWFDFGYRVNPVDYLFSIVMAVWLVRWIRRIDASAENSAIARNLSREKGGEAPQSPVNEQEKMERFCSYYKMTGRETQVLGLILSGRSNQEIADALFITVGTVKHHVHNIFTKLEIERRSQLMRMFIDFQEPEE